MPITLTTASHSPRKWQGRRVSTSEELLTRSCPDDQRQSQRLIRSSFPRRFFRDNNVSASKHGFVWAVFDAYSNHHNLTIRPEDVWFSILTQLSFFINAHAEELRSFFVSHEGQKELEVIQNATMEDADFGAMALEMTRLIEKNVVDEELRAWIMPTFTTTTESDNVVAAILMMGTMQSYFSYKMTLTCGIPCVTLLGEKDDWNQLVNKLDKLHQLGDQPARFAQLLRPVLNHFVASFENPTSPTVLDFWNRCAHKENMGSGPDYLCGWISVFCFWDEGGGLLHREPIQNASSPEFQARNSKLGLEDALSRRIDTDDVPSGFASVPVTVEDTRNNKTYKTVMLAGLVGIQATSSGDITIAPPTEAPGLDSIQPLSGWWMYEKRSAVEAKIRQYWNGWLDPLSGK
ncbi:hypothetical protein P170DRAFT_454715 [Aspergillus steynii IBT 23096]|uniref:DUF4419 domain-containing protein n=1 Tax=Aspergillus steynii IBT 23096 TaxID=1392250 RepID=A0A2I2GB66_9EURO|nr:uncharacterized protein P170DRAFT_454715 [Aspergillus steynii IBT 23096]PLB50087.1 hypothetical protein P170DRAFT_454715 [Aspergillus steynii IBT 23096]